MSDKHIAQLTYLKIGTQTYNLIFNLEAVAVAEDIADRPLLLGLSNRDYNKPTINLVRAMLFACISTYHEEITFQEVKSLVTQKNIAEIWAKVLQAWVAGLVEPKAEEVEVDEPKDFPEVQS